MRKKVLTNIHGKITSLKITRFPVSSLLIARLLSINPTLFAKLFSLRMSYYYYLYIITKRSQSSTFLETVNIVITFQRFSLG